MLHKKRALILLLVLSIVLACDPKEDTDPAVEAVQNISFTQVMAPSPFAAADYISVSPNGQYMVFSLQQNTAFKDYYSNDAGETVHELNLNRTIYNRNRPVQTNISNDGLFLFEGGLFNLNNAGPTMHNATGVTDSGKLIYIQNDGSQGQTFFFDDNGTYVSTGVRLEMDADYYLGTSGEKMGFFDHTNKTIAEFDATQVTYNQRTLDLDYGRIGGFGQYTGEIKTAYSYGYFAYAKSGGLLIISPNDEVTYYVYPAMGASYHNTVRLSLFRDRAYVQLVDGNTYEAYQGELNKVDMSFPIERAGDGIYTQGFIENGDRFRSGIIKTENGRQEYLPLDMGYQYPSGYMFGKAYAIGNYVYAEDKVFDRNNNTYATSPTGAITSILHDDGRTIAYTESGTYTTINGRDWNLENTNPPAPELVTKGTDGLYHALTVEIKVYVSPGTQARTYSADLKAYTSGNGIDWTEVSGSATNHLGYGPRLISSDGVVYTRDTNAGSIGSARLSEDFGVNWQGLLDGMNLDKNEPVPDGFKTSQFELSSGRFVSIVFEFDGEMEISLCESSTGGCTEQTLQVSFDASDMYQYDEDITLTANDEFVFNTLDGVYISSSLK
ncbi:hypothetical protein [Roseivirga sp.]|uniref:hypothetical protein n=1 Tax=Roseivirga sp. TaxID=1964215 RepID=UPI003B527E0D